MEKFKIPQEHRQLLISPAFEEWDHLIKKNRKIEGRFKPYAVGCGHGVEFFHPGALFKEIAVNRYKKDRGCSIVCDFDNLSEKSFKFPFNGCCRAIEFIDSSNNIWKKKEISKIIEEVKGNPQAERYFKTALRLRSRYSSLAQIITEAREEFLRQYGFSLPYVYLSELLNTDMYRKFYERINRKKDEFARIYNIALQKMPYQTGIKNLTNGELPFRKIGSGVTVPKVIPLTIFLRLYIFDLYVEGIGGSHYRLAADYLIRNFFNEDVPATVVASATLWYGSVRQETTNRINELERHLRRMKENPQEFTGRKEDIEEVKKIMKYLRKSQDKRQVHQKLIAKKEEVRKKIIQQIVKKEAELKRLEENLKVSSREYPFFVYPEKDIKYLFEACK